MSGPDPGIAQTYRAWAKVNLYLEVLGRRADGYHDISSLIVFAACGDRLILRPAVRREIRVSGPFGAALPASGDNLVERALDALGAALGRPINLEVELEKVLPIAAGLGGGSADAAVALDGALEVLGLSLDGDMLDQVALSIGADLPVCRYGRPAQVGGLGDRIRRAPPLPAGWLVLANPGVSLATAEVFAARSGPFSPANDWSAIPLDTTDLAGELAVRRNDLEPAARRLAPIIDDVLDGLQASDGCLLARMTGSGATCFGLFGRSDLAEEAARRLAQVNPDWWLRACPILHGKLARHWRDDPAP